MIGKKRIESLANKARGSLKVPINVEELVRPCRIIEHRFGPYVTSVLYNPNGTIGVNVSLSSVRKRFAITHSFSHYLLHKSKEIFIETKFVPRKGDEYTEENEANKLAAAILLPEKELKELSLNLDLSESYNQIKEIADHFGVSSQLVVYRYSNLNLL